MNDAPKRRNFVRKSVSCDRHTFCLSCSTNHCGSVAVVRIGESADTDEEKSDDEVENVESAEEEDQIWKLSRQKDKDARGKESQRCTPSEMSLKEENTQSVKVVAQDLHKDNNPINNSNRVKKTSPSTAPSKMVKDEMMLDETEKLARIRAKYPARKMKKAPIIVEAKPLDL
ncbi:unnamed protein product, partial [Toxocara canis]